MNSWSFPINQRKITINHHKSIIESSYNHLDNTINFNPKLKDDIRFEFILSGKHIDDKQFPVNNFIINNNKALIQGNTNFIGAELMSSDLRASVALVLAALVSDGRSYINRIYHLDRGYEKIENKLKKIGVSIKRLK